MQGRSDDLVRGPGVGSQKDLGAFDLPHCGPAAAQQRAKLVTFRLAEFDAIP
jgi:hypothetical protein